MSDPVTNAEVEDVLSSIRRLVSEDKRPVQTPKAEARSDRLVLTPSLRVSDDEADQTDREASGRNTFNRQDNDSTDENAASADETPEVAIGSLLTDDAAIDVYEEEQSGWNDSDVSDLALDDEEDAFDAPDTSDHATDYSSDPYGFDKDENISGGQEDDIILSTAQSAAAGDDGGSDIKMTDMDRIERDKVALGAAGSPDDNVETHADDTGQRADVAEEVKSAALTAKITALETAIGQISETWEPDEAGEGDYAGTEPQAMEMEWEDDQPENTPVFVSRSGHRDETDGRERQSFEPAFGASDNNNDDLADEPETAAASKPSDEGMRLDPEEQLIDEEALRDLVSDIVRAELQGALGERITRNVRKLVRREIHRALTAQELE